MRVRRAETLGFCMGVRRAMEMAEAALSRAALSRAASSQAASSQSPLSRAGTVYAMGNLIHNKQAMEPLVKQGLRVADEATIPEDLQGVPVVIRAHGVSPGLEALLIGRGALLIDATCPKVKASQLKAQELRRGGCRVFLAGERSHAEIIGVLGYAPDCVVVGSPAEAAAAAEKLRREAGDAAAALIGQTTWDGAEYAAIADAIRAFFPDLAVCDTICGATRARQDSLRSLCAEVDAVIVAGARESANTRRLLDIALSFPGGGKPAWLAETPDDIPPDIDRYDSVGLCAGASTPDALIGAIEAALLERTAGP